MKLIRPKALTSGATIGIFTPSSPSHIALRKKYLHGLSVIKSFGFKVKEGWLTASEKHQGYRSGSPKDRADEFMALIRDPEVDCLVSTIGGANSSSMIPYLDFDEIRANPKIISGYSDVTSLHLAILAYSGLSTFYGPAVVPSFGEWPTMIEETKNSFFDAVTTTSGTKLLSVPSRWSNHFRDAKGDGWKTDPRQWEQNPGWRCLVSGEATAPVVVVNLNTLLTTAGTTCFPDLNGKILILEEMEAPMSRLERNLRHLERLGVFGVIKGLIFGKPEFFVQENAPFGLEDLLLEVLGPQANYPVVVNFDCGHAHPSLTIAEMASLTLNAKSDFEVIVRINEPMVN